MKPLSFSYESMGTHWEVSIWDEIENKKLESLRETVIEQSHAFDTTYSRFIKDSFVTQISTHTGMLKIQPEFMEILNLYKKMYELSAGKFTPLVGTTLEDMGYDSRYSLHQKQSIHTVPPFDQAVEFIDDEYIKINEPVLFDIGALGKGYFVDRIHTLLAKENLTRFLVNGSGDISYKGNGEVIQVGLEHPENASQIIGVIEMEKGSMCSSGSNRRAWGNYHHIIDPVSLQSPDEIIASWVIADSAAIADGLATAFFLVPPEHFENHFSFEYLLLNKDMKVKKSEGFGATLFS